MNCKYKVNIKDIQYNYKVSMDNIQSKYKLKIFCSGYDDSEIKEKINTMYEAWPKVSGEGETISLSNTVTAPVTIGLKGNTSQETTTGKNLLNESTFEIGSIDAVTGQNVSNNLEFRTNGYIEVESGETYTLSNYNYTNYTYRGIFEYDSNKTYIKRTNDTVASTSQGFSLALSSTTKYVRIRYIVGSTITTVPSNMKIQYEKGSTATSYEPYTNGASPNPDYPQDIHVVSGNNSIDVCGKNLSNMAFTISLTSGNEKWGTRAMTTENSSVKWEVGKDYYIRAFYNQQSNEVAQITNYGYTRIDNATRKITFNGTIPSVRVGANSLSANITNEEIKIMVATDTFYTYEAYTGASYPINLGSIELCKIGDYQDSIVKDNGKWYLNKQIGKRLLDGTENWNYASNLGAFYIGDYIGTITNDDIGAYSNKYLAVSRNNYNASNYTIYGNNVKVLSIRDTDYTSVSTFRTYLQTANVIVYYILKTPTYTEITDSTLISQLEAIAEAEGYTGQTNISQTNSDKPFIITAKALKDLSNL